MTNATTINGRQNITSTEQIHSLAKSLPNGFHVIVVFDYRNAVAVNNITLPGPAFDQSYLCKQVGAQFDNHQVIVCVMKNSYHNNKWMIANFSDNFVFVTDDLDNLRIQVNTCNHGFIYE